MHVNNSKRRLTIKDLFYFSLKKCEDSHCAQALFLTFCFYTTTNIFQYLGECSVWWSNLGQRLLQVVVIALASVLTPILWFSSVLTQIPLIGSHVNPFLFLYLFLYVVIKIIGAFSKPSSDSYLPMK